MLTNDDHMTAEMLVKEIGYSRSGEGKSSLGTSGMTEVIRGTGIPETGLLVVDGSGVSSGNLVTCEIMRRIADHEPLTPIFENAFPVAGEEGTVADQFANSQFESNLKAKSSRSSTTAALLGYFTSSSEEKLTVSFMVNHEDTQSWIESDLDDFFIDLADYLSSFSSGLPIEMLEPK